MAALRRSDRDWELLDAQGARIISAPRVVLANAQDLRRLVPQALAPASPVRGQITRLRADIPGLRLPRLPLAGAGYVLPAHHGWTLCGATTQPDDNDPEVRESDHLHNLQQLARLTGSSIDVDMNELQGRVAWRCVSPDRLPLIGPVPAARRAGQRCWRNQPETGPAALRAPSRRPLHVHRIGFAGHHLGCTGSRIARLMDQRKPLPCRGQLAGRD